MALESTVILKVLAMKEIGKTTVSMGLVLSIGKREPSMKVNMKWE